VLDVLRSVGDVTDVSPEDSAGPLPLRRPADGVSAVETARGLNTQRITSLKDLKDSEGTISKYNQRVGLYMF